MTNDQRPRARRLFSAVNSLATKAILLVAIFIACPLIVYVELRAADQEKSQLLVQSVQEQGRLLALALTPSLRRFGEGRTPALQKELSHIVTGATKVKVLFRPDKSRDTKGFFYVASWPEVSSAYIDAERKFLVETGLLDQLGNSCGGNRALALRYTNPAGEWELLSSITPVHTRAGCWVVLTSIGGADGAGISIGQPYWESPEVKFAAAIYVIMAVLTLSLFIGVWRSLRRFAQLAKDIATRGHRRGSFVALNRVPELGGVAGEFDRMVDGLGASAKAIREAAEETAHAFKTPIAVIAQSMEPLKQSLSPQDERARRALDLVERATERLDALVGAARHMDEAIADLISPPRERVELSRLLTGMIAGYIESAALGNVALSAAVEPGIAVAASDDLMEVTVENLLDNAVSFSPPHADVMVTLSRENGEAVLAIADRGPGVETGNMERIFDRYFSDRGPRHPAPGENTDGGGAHFGMGLWIVRRNVEAIGGRVYAENRPGGGLKVVIHLPIYV